jgi:hypothetical protein
MAIVGEPFASYVDKQIKVRQEQMGKLSDRGPEMIAWANSKTAWVKIASGVFLSGSFAEERLENIGLSPTTDYMGTQLSQKYILFGGTAERKKEDPNDPATPYILQQRSSVSEVYNFEDTPFGIVPMPGIESIDVKDKNRGSIKEANVQIKAYSRRQLEIIDTLYLRLGYTMLLEWGNSHYIANDGTYKKMGTTCAEKYTYFFANKEDKNHPRSHRDFLSAIEGLRDDYDGNYDGFLAKVTNFSWTFEPDGTYKITLKLISLGDIIESLKINLSPSKDTVYVKDDEDETTKEPVESPTVLDEMLNQYKTIIKLEQNSSTLAVYPKVQTLPTEILPERSNGVFISADKISFEDENITFGVFEISEWEDIGFAEFVKRKKQEILDRYDISTIVNNNGIVNYDLRNTNANEIIEQGFSKLKDPTSITDAAAPGRAIKIFINIPPQTITLQNTLGGGEEVFFMAYAEDADSEWGWEVEKGEEKNEKYYIRMEAFLNFLNKYCFPVYGSSGNEEPIVKIKTLDNRCHTMPNQISYDPRVCLIRNRLRYPGEDGPVYDIFRFLAPFTGESFEKEYGDINRIYLNYAMIKNKIADNQDERGDLSPQSLLEAICNEINKALGGINNLEPVLNELKNEIEIIDTSYVSEKINNPQTAFQIYGYNGKTGSDSESTFVRNVNLATKISPEFASMVTVGATAGGYTKGMEATAFSKWNRGMVDRFAEEYKPPKSVTPAKSSSNPDLPQDHYAEMLNLLDFEELGYNTSEDEYVTLKGAAGEYELDTLIINSGKIATNISVATEYFKYLRAKSYKDNPDEYASTANGFIPFNLQLTMDGLSGMKIYNKIEVDTRFLPFNYPETLKFIVKRVSHKLSNGDWETSVDTTVIPGAYDFSGGGGTP